MIRLGLKRNETMAAWQAAVETRNRRLEKTNPAFFGHAAVGNPHFAAVDDPVVAFLDGVRRGCSHVATSPRLRHAIGRLNGGFCKPPQVSEAHPPTT